MISNVNTAAVVTFGGTPRDDPEFRDQRRIRAPATPPALADNMPPEKALPGRASGAGRVAPMQMVPKEAISPIVGSVLREPRTGLRRVMRAALGGVRAPRLVG